MANPRRAIDSSALGWVSLLILLGLHVTWLWEPFDLSHAGQLGADSYAYSCRAFEHHGWWALRGMPSSFYLYETLEGFVPYLHHPLGAYALVHVVARQGHHSMAAYQVVPLLLVVLTGGAIWALGRTRSRTTAGWALCVFSVSPLTIHYGRMVESFVFGLAGMPLIVLLWWRVLDRPTRCRKVAYALLTLGFAVTNWYVFFVLPPLTLGLFTSRRFRGSRTRSFVLLAVPFVLAGFVHLAWLCWALQDLGLVASELNWLGRVPFGAGMEAFSWIGRTFSYGEGLAQHVHEGFGPLIAGLAGLGLVRSGARLLKGQGQRLDHIALVLFVAGALPSLVFWRRAAAHAFWVLHLLPAVSLLAAMGVEGLFKLGRVPRPVVVGALCLGLLATGWMGLERHRESRGSGLAEALGAELSSRTLASDVLLIPYQDYSNTLLYWTPRSVMPTASSQGLYEEALGRLAAARSHVGRWWLAARVRTLTLPEMAWVRGLPFVASSAQVFSIRGEEWRMAQIRPGESARGR